ncbi:glycosyltransferase [Lentzea sp. NEAU-D7]|uniref:glycosyltransferase n=1 Tax=Lentzea sp. NEAU-D7 TaxID=2994667 RepID=UPI00224B8123|nr:glycosyltransferase [Lentzea sp. NEAU-D7]MCX2950182.1 glycosyltransferase [Lentzea sp. NEAU-D7]
MPDGGRVRHHEVLAYDTGRLESVLGADRVRAFNERLEWAAGALKGRRLVNVTGDDQRKGGVYEIMRGTIPYLRGAGIDVLWVDLTTSPKARPSLEFFHLLAHGRSVAADWRAEFPVRTAEFVEFGRAAAPELVQLLRPSDFLVLHDTQTAPVLPELRPWRDSLLWHAHIGTGDQNELVDGYWEIVGPNVAAAGGRVFYRPEYAPPALRDSSIFASPGVDPSAPKSIPLDRDEARRALSSPPAAWPLTWLTGQDRLFDEPHQVVAAQLSRWDPLKDMSGAFRVFAEVAARVPSFVGLVVGPSAQSASERAELELCLEEWKKAAPDISSRVHIGVIENCGTAEHDDAVRTVQSAADVILQKSVQEGFGLTVTEAMLRGKPVVAAAVGGIPLQLHDRHNGVLVDPGSDETSWADHLHELVSNNDLRSRLGTRALGDVLEHHTVDRHLNAVIDAVAEMPPCDAPPGGR